MARQRTPVSNAAKKRLRAQAGGKCANPGCPTTRTHVHHIREWAIFETNDEEYLIAVCPTCHDAAHHGELPIDDDTILRWKSTPRSVGLKRGHLYVEPGDTTRLLLGSVAISAPSEAIVFQLSKNNRLAFRVKEGDLLLLDAEVRDLAGQEVIRIVDNHVRSEHYPHTTLSQRPGRVRLSTSAVDEFIHPWMVALMRKRDPQFAAGGETAVLDLEVTAPGLVRVQGLWVDGELAVVITQSFLSFLHPGLEQPISLAGEGRESTLAYVGPINRAMFGFES